MKQKGLLVIAGIIFCLLGAALQIQAEELTGREIVDKARTLGAVEDMKAQLEMKIIHSSNQVRVRKLKYFSRENSQGIEKSLVRFLEPADVRGTGFLTITNPEKMDEKYLYLPALGRPRRISSEERGNSFMGSDFSYEDMSPNMEDYNYKLIGEEDLEGEQVYMVKAVPVSDQLKEEVGFAYRKIWIHRDNFTISKSITFDEAGTKLKVMTGDNIKKVAANLWMATELTMKDLEDGSRTELVYKNIEVNTGLTDQFFSIRQLTRPQF